MRKVERILIIVMLITAGIFFLKSCKTGVPKAPEHKYEFRAATDEESKNNIFLGSKLCDVYNYSDEGINVATAYGQLRTLFGEPKHITKDMENLYEYDIVATNEEGKEIYLYAYNGPSGAAIGGDISDEAASDAAKQLARWISYQTPADFECEAYYFDGPSKVVMEVKDGKAKVWETRLTGEEYQKAYDECYGNLED